MTDFAIRVTSLRPALLRFAKSRLRNDTWAEDAVSETILAALEKPDSFRGLSRLKTWLTAILKFKLADQLRRNARETPSSFDSDGDDIDDTLFDSDGAWRDIPQQWPAPEEACEQREFLEVLEKCCKQLPAMQARVFMMRECLELDADEICAELGITQNNLWVLLHRARLRLHKSLQQHWFNA